MINVVIIYDMMLKMKNEIVSFKITQETADKMMDFYADYKEENNGDYIIFFAKYNKISITIYESKKGYKALFMGPNALYEAHIWDINAKVVEIKKKDQEEWLSLNYQIGSDEVGVGDLFLPMIVVAAYVSKEDIKELIDLGIHDSKKLKDEFILEIGPILIKRFNVSKLTLHNYKYNEMISKGENLNSLKAKMHNQALLNMKKKYPFVKEIYVDEFAKENTYYSYLINEKEIQKDITFKTKGESYYPSVALASVIARYQFLIEKRKLEEKYQMDFPFGASKKADEFLVLFKEKYGEEELLKVVKKNFANVNKVL